jgi:hypothetical protein
MYVGECFLPNEGGRPHNAEERTVIIHNSLSKLIDLPEQRCVG